MRPINIETQSLGVRELTTQVPLYRERYDRLLGVLGDFGTQVVVDRTLEKDVDIPPGNFVRKGRHEFVFPPFDLGNPTLSKSEVRDPSPDYGLVYEREEYGFDPTKVTGHLEVTYDDAGSGVVMGVVDLLGNSELPPEVLAELNALNSPFQEQK